MADEEIEEVAYALYDIVWLIQSSSSSNEVKFSFESAPVSTASTFPIPAFVKRLPETPNLCASDPILCEAFHHFGRSNLDVDIVDLKAISPWAAFTEAQVVAQCPQRDQRALGKAIAKAKAFRIDKNITLGRGRQVRFLLVSYFGSNCVLVF